MPVDSNMSGLVNLAGNHNYLFVPKEKIRVRQAYYLVKHVIMDNNFQRDYSEIDIFSKSNITTIPIIVWAIHGDNIEVFSKSGTEFLPKTYYERFWGLRGKL